MNWNDYNSKVSMIWNLLENVQVKDYRFCDSSKMATPN